MPEAPTADLVLYGGTILTLDRPARGAGAALLALAGPAARRVDLAGRTVVPGLIDAHAHLDREGLKALGPSLGGARSIDDVLQKIEALVRAAAPGQWIVTMPPGDPPSYFDVPGGPRERRFPTRRGPDRVAPAHPGSLRAAPGLR